MRPYSPTFSYQINKKYWLKMPKKKKDSEKLKPRVDENRHHDSSILASQTNGYRALAGAWPGFF